MRIAICDDVLADVQHMKELLKNYFDVEFKADYGQTNSGQPESTVVAESAVVPESTVVAKSIVVDEYTDVREMLEHGIYDIYFMDIMMGEISGLEAAKIIRRRESQESEIIFTTSCKEFALDAYEVYARQYLLKPVEQRDVSQVLNIVLKNMIQNENNEQNHVIAIKTSTGMTQMTYGEIMYVENVSRILMFHLTGGQVVNSVYIRSSFEKEIQELLETSEFIQPHKSYVINMHHIRKYMQNELLMKDDTIVPVSKNNVAAVKRRYLEYLARDFSTDTC